jgi:hypothetical protein
MTTICPQINRFTYNCNLCNKEHTEGFFNNFIIHTQNKIYNTFTEIPDEEKKNVYFIEKIPFELLEKSNKYYNIQKITCFENIISIKVNIHNLSYLNKKINPRNLYYEDIINHKLSHDENNYFTNEIAQLQKLSNIIYTDSFKNELCIYDIMKPLFYIYEDKMLIIMSEKRNKIPNIPENIKYLNIISYYNYKFNNIPENIKYLNLSFNSKNIDKVTLDNLPINIKKINISLYVDNDNKNKLVIEEQENILQKKIKIPFDCELKISILNL